MPIARFISLPVVKLTFYTVLILTLFTASKAQDGPAVYQQIKSFALDGGKTDAVELVLKRDRVEMTFTGVFYFTAPVQGHVTGAVFIGSGHFKAETPPSDFEHDNVLRMLKADSVESDFKTAVLQFSDDTFDVLGKGRTDGAPTEEARKLASETNERILKESGANISARVALSIINGESPGFFFASFDGGKLDRFSFLLDPQKRIPTANFDINGGEVGLIFKYQKTLLSNDIFLAFYGKADYDSRIVEYSDQNDLIDITHYQIELDLRDPKRALGVKAKLKMQARSDGIRAIPFLIGESLGEDDNQRLKKQLRLQSARFEGSELEKVQEDWEGGFTIFLPRSIKAGEQIEIEFNLSGDFLMQPEIPGLSYPLSNESWYPRHGYLDRATYDLTYVHSKKLKIASVGRRLSEDPDPNDKDLTVTKYIMEQPVALVTFAIGPFIRYSDTIKWENGDKPTPLEYNSLSGSFVDIKEDFMMAEMSNSIRFFHSLFGTYPYDSFSATFHPFGFGQGFPTMLMIPGTDRESKYTYSFISHETSHQWWGNIVAWRSYRDQWLSEGFAEYSGVLYTSFRQNPKAARQLIDEMRASIRRPPETTYGVGKGKLNDIGPLVLGHRLSSSKSLGGYSTLIYNKGALVLRMIHFLLTDPATGSGQPFFDMMKDFVDRYKDKTASTDDFRRVANEHYAKSPNGKKYGVPNLDWFFRQWVFKTDLPSYRLEYKVETQPDGTLMLTGNVIQENVPDGFFMPLPVRIKFAGDKFAESNVAALGRITPFKIKIPMRPEKVELDPGSWVLSEKTETKGL